MDRHPAEHRHTPGRTEIWTPRLHWLDLLIVLALSCDGASNLPGPPSRVPTLDERITMPDGFHISVFAENLIRPRSLVLGDSGTVFAGTYWFTKGVTSPIYALRDRNGDGVADWVREVRFNFNSPNGLAVVDGDLYVSDEDKVYRIPDIENSIGRPSPQLIHAGLPSRVQTDSATDVGHFWRYMTAGPDGMLYIAVGTRWSFLVGSHTARDLDDDPVYSTIVRLTTSGSGLEIFADGVRNSMGMEFHPVTGELWFTDNGPSWPFEDPRFYDIPPDELNRAPGPGLHFGFPYYHGRLPDPLIGEDAPQMAFPEHDFLAHTAPLGMTFYTGDMFPERFVNQIFVAEHGTEPTTPAPRDRLHGDRISMIMLGEDGRVVGYEVFADGFLRGSNANYDRRPVDLLVMPDGALLVSDDVAGVIYRIWYDEAAAGG